MALDPAGHVSYFMCVPIAHRDYLGSIRHWHNLKTAVEEQLVWIKDLTAQQIDSIEVKSIPYRQLYWAAGSQLFLQGSLLPARHLPVLLWSPIERGLPVTLPAFNHNFFGISGKAAFPVVASDRECAAYAMLTDQRLLGQYLETAPAIRVKGLRWVLTDDKALVIGTPLLPLKGSVYWRRNDFLIPAGYAPELDVLMETVGNMLNPEQACWIVWTPESEYWKVDKTLLKPLSAGSFRLSVK